MWHLIGQISTSFSLVAFLGAAGLLAYRATLRNRVQLLKSVPGADRAEIISRQLNSFGINASGLNRQQQYDLALRELEIREKRLRYTAIVIVFLASISGTVAIYGFSTGARTADVSRSPLPEARSTSNVSGVVSPGPSTQVLDLITQTADSICNVISTRGEAGSSEVKGQVTAQLSGLAAKLAGVGVSGTGRITSEQYQGVLRTDL